MPKKKLQLGGSLTSSTGASASSGGIGGGEFGSFFKNTSAIDPSLIGGQIDTVLKGITKAGEPPKTEASEASRKLIAKGLDTALGVPVGTALDVTGKIYQNFTRDEDGLYKNKFAQVVENLNPINLTSNLVSGDFSGKKQAREVKINKAKKLAQEKRVKRDRELPLIARNFALRNQFAPVFKEGGRLNFSFGEKNDKFNKKKLLSAKKGTSLNKGCGCNIASDGIDTDIFKKLQPDEMRIIQIELGTKPSGLYSDTDKQKMKDGAKMSNKNLKDYLMDNNRIKSVIHKLL